MTDSFIDRSNTYCVIGAGAGGLTAAKNLLEQGIDVDVIERESQVGGVWNYGGSRSAAYRSIHLITSKKWIQYPDYPIPDSYPTYLGHTHAQQYLNDYAETFDVKQHIEFGRTVEWVDRQDGSAHWIVTLDGGEQRRYGGVIIANGHLWKGRQPTHPGEFDGLIMHSSEYRTPDIFRGKRVLVVGSGTSGADIAVEAGLNADASFMSVRRGCYYWPKYLFGLPTDTVYEAVLKLHMPLPVIRFFGKGFIRLNSAGTPTQYGLPTPPHKLLEEHFVINSALLYNLGHGEIVVKKDVSRLDGKSVVFSDGTSELIDIIIYATGYDQTTFPFIDTKHLNWNGAMPNLHLNCFHPQYDNLFMVGYFQTTTGTWQVMDYQSRVIARYIRLSREDPQRVAWLRRQKQTPVRAGQLSNGYNYYDSERHWLQVEHSTFRRKLRKMAKKLSVKHLSPADAVPIRERQLVGSGV